MQAFALNFIFNCCASYVHYISDRSQILLYMFQEHTPSSSPLFFFIHFQKLFYSSEALLGYHTNQSQTIMEWNTTQTQLFQLFFLLNKDQYISLRGIKTSSFALTFFAFHSIETCVPSRTLTFNNPPTHSRI